MNLTFHPAVERDVKAILAYYTKEGGERLADRFFSELQARFVEIAAHPTRFPYYLGNGFLRRATLHKFPHLILYRVMPDGVRVSVVKHEKRHPNYGLWRS
ncbi:MAG: type II toxin-antitoxin system RelE/ParE family toxin [Verrucomicrobia bacterium]|nr:type II toxin-antitoxin system RelE/ParE family toxin [Verrucomicrobiota bacterium]